VLNMGLLGSLAGYCVYAPLRRAIGGPTGVAVAAVVAAWFAVLLAAVAASVELACAGTHAFGPVLQAMLWVHFLIGLGEAAITGGAVAFILKARPDLVYDPDTA